MKYQFLITSSKDSHTVFADKVRREWVPLFKGTGPRKLKISLPPGRPPRLSVVPYRNEALALVSLWTDAPLSREFLHDLSAQGDCRVGAYLVEESYPVADESRPEGGATPGAVLLTCIVKNQALDYATFMAEWFGKHSPLTLKVHPLKEYIRNVVKENLFDNQTPFDGIVEERFDSPGALFNPAKMFGGPLVMIPNMIRIGRHVHHFLDLKKTWSYYLKEYFIIR